MTITVNRSITGSFCVIMFNLTSWGCEMYIDARKDRRHKNYTFIEIVKNGEVIFREDVYNTNAPGRLIELTKFLLNGGTFAYHKTSCKDQGIAYQGRRSGESQARFSELDCHCQLERC